MCFLDASHQHSCHKCSYSHSPGGRWSLSGDDVECVAVGASLLGCGGGGDPNMGRLVVLQKLASGKTITVVNPYR